MSYACVAYHVLQARWQTRALQITLKEASVMDKEHRRTNESYIVIATRLRFPYWILGIITLESKFNVGKTMHLSKKFQGEMAKAVSIFYKNIEEMRPLTMDDMCCVSSFQYFLQNNQITCIDTTLFDYKKLSFLFLLINLKQEEQRALQSEVKYKAEPSWFEENRVKVFTFVIESEDIPSHAPSIVQSFYEAQKTLYDYDIKTLEDDTHQSKVVAYEHKFYKYQCHVKSLAQFPISSVCGVARLFKELVDLKQLQGLIQDKTVQIYYHFGCRVYEKASGIDLLKRWWVGTDTYLGAKQFLISRLVRGQLQLKPGCHGSVFYEGPLVGAHGLYASHACVSLLPFTTASVSCLFFGDKMQDLDGEIIELNGTRILIAVDVQSQVLELYKDCKCSEVRRYIKMAKAETKKMHAIPIPKDSSEFEANKRAYEARQIEVREGQKAIEMKRRDEVEKDRASRTSQKKTLDLPFKAPTSIVQKAKRESSKEMNFDRMRHHRRALKEKELVKVLQYKQQMRMIEIGERITRGD